jgi:polyhydroxyalkanoate synthase subunit PhaC
MADQPDPPNPAELAETLSGIAEKSQNLISEFLKQQNPFTATQAGQSAKKGDNSDPLNLAGAFIEMTSRLISDPAAMAKAQVSLWQGYMALWQNMSDRMAGGAPDPVATPDSDDRRFRDPEWSENPLFDFIKQSYLLTSRWMVDTVRDIDGLDDATTRKLDFYTRQFTDAMAPTNFLMSNPQVLRETMESKGDNLVKGLANLLEDLEAGKGAMRIKHVDPNAFQVGVDIATSPGKVVFQTDLMQLVQFAPSTETVRKRPLLIVPPWINKFYILDLREDNSFIRWAVGQGHTVFVVSWINPDASLAEKSFEDYMLEGPLAAIDAIEQATGEKQINLIGYCIGGTLTAATLAYLASKRRANRIASVTYFTTMVDFADPGELGVFIDETQVQMLEERMNEQGYLDGADMATTFNMLRANDLIWSFVINNYLMGRTPYPFDLLFWNSDSTRMPAAMHSYYLRKMYMENKLIEPGGLTLDGVKIDLRKIKTPTFILSTREDHIAPWKSAYSPANIYAGNVKFVLSSSGHVAGVINPPGNSKYNHWTNDETPADPEDWLTGATEKPGSWWPHWDEWVEGFADGEVPARTPGDGKLEAREDAPGSYVLARTMED